MSPSPCIDDTFATPMCSAIRPAPRPAVAPWRAAWLRTLLALLGLSLTAACTTLPPRGVAVESQAIVDTNATLARSVAASQPPAQEGNSGFRLLPSADHAFAARDTMSRRAERTLDAQYYHVHHDTAGATFLRGLVEAAQRGVRVRLLVDDLHNTAIVPWLKVLALQPGAQVRFFNPIPSRHGGIAWRLLAASDDFDRTNRRMHNKLFIADNALALFGGRNIGDEYFSMDLRANFIDLDVLGAGPVVQQLSNAFDSYWNSEHAWPLADLERLPSDAQAATLAFLREAAVLQLEVKPTPRDPLGNTPLADQLATGRLSLSWANASVFADPPDKITAAVVLGQPSLAMHGQLEIIGRARSEVFLVNPYFVPDDTGLQSMADARAKGIRGIFITNSLGSTDEPLAYFYYSRKRARMLKLGVEIYELSPTLPQRTQSLGNFGRSLARLHAKGGIVDNRWLLVGSVNLDARSALLNTELGVAIDSPELARQARSLIAGEQFLNMYRVTLDPGDQVTRWTWTEPDGTPRTSTQSPHFDPWQWFKLLLQSLFVAERLL